MKLTLNHSARRRFEQAFTLLEVMIAMAMFFIAIFAILELTSRSLSAARSLQRTLVDPGILASELSLTNKLEEGPISGDLSDVYPGVTWTGDIVEAYSNGLYRVDFFLVQETAGNPSVSAMSILLYRPESVQGSATRLRLNTRSAPR